MNSKETLLLWNKVSDCIAEEIAINEVFAKKILKVLEVNNISPKSKKRQPAKIDPFALYEQGGDKLAESLALLSIDELKDVIAANAMDSSKLAMRWSKRSRLENLIIEATQHMSSRGEAFWNS